jgi:ATP-dependent DNA helicase DinG
MTHDFEKEIRDFLGPRGLLKKLLPTYEHRPEQADMAAAVLRAFDRNGLLVVEAGTGTGKTLAYLAPALYSNRKVLISTGTKALQEQLIYKDLPVLERAFNVRAAIMKGRSNYLCWQRYHEFERAPTFNFRDEISVWDRIRAWSLKTATGDRAEIKDLPDQWSAWRELSATGEQCLGQKCGYFDNCFITRMRGQAQAADILIVNHHLFFADLAIRDTAPSSVLPEYQTVIFDEAHDLAATATEFFGLQVSTWRVQDLGQDLRRIQRLGQMPMGELRGLLSALERAEGAASDFFRVVADAGWGGAERGEGSRFSLAPLKDRPALVEEGDRARAEFKLLAKLLADAGKKDELLLGLGLRAEQFGSDLGFIVRMDDPDHVFWAETRGRGVIMRASPSDLGPLLAERLFGRNFPIVFTSATLAVQDRSCWSFAHFRSELGLKEPTRPLEETCLPSSYDWPNQAILYVPADLPEPTSPGFIRAASREMLRILRLSRGRAFLLFTSYRNLEAAYELLAPHLEFPVLKQGDMPKSTILEEFRNQGNAVLFATQSFWEGVDVTGQALSCVIIDKLPFASPSDPLLAARIDRIRRQGGNPFMDYQLPAAVIALKQGLGRLIRSKDDYGILAVLDSRLHTKRYGKTFLQSIPPAPLTTKLEDVKAFIDRHEGEGVGCSRGEENTETQRHKDPEKKR